MARVSSLRAVPGVVPVGHRLHNPPLGVHHHQLETGHAEDPEEQRQAGLPVTGLDPADGRRGDPGGRGQLSLTQVGDAPCPPHQTVNGKRPQPARRPVPVSDVLHIDSLPGSPLPRDPAVDNAVAHCLWTTSPGCVLPARQRQDALRPPRWTTGLEAPPLPRGGRCHAWGLAANDGSPGSPWAQAPSTIPRSRFALHTRGHHPFALPTRRRRRGRDASQEHSRTRARISGRSRQMFSGRSSTSRSTHPHRSSRAWSGSWRLARQTGTTRSALPATCRRGTPFAHGHPHCISAAHCPVAYRRAEQRGVGVWSTPGIGVTLSAPEGMTRARTDDGDGTRRRSRRAISDEQGG
jgi:hypothetical protein